MLCKIIIIVKNSFVFVFIDKLKYLDANTNEKNKIIPTTKGEIK